MAEERAAASVRAGVHSSAGDRTVWAVPHDVKNAAAMPKITARTTRRLTRRTPRKGDKAATT